MNILALATRSALRKWQRTMVTTVAMAFAGFIMILFASLMEGLLRASEHNVVAMDLGEVQIYASGYRDDPDLHTRIKNPEPLLTRLESQGWYAAPRLHGFALAASGSASSGVQLRGVDLVREPRVTQLSQHLVSGQWLDAAQPQGVVIGRKLARTLGVELGGEIVIVGQAADGSMANELYYLRGVLKSISGEIDRAGFFLTDEAMRELMMLDQSTHEIALMRSDRSGDLSAATSMVRTLAAGLEVTDWRQLRPVVARILDMGDAQMVVMILITYIAVAMVVLNAMLMAVLERIHEFGVMKAVGVAPRQIVGLIYAETVIQTVVAAALALGSGWLAASHFQNHGIDLSNMASSASFGGIALDPIWHAHLSLRTVVMPIAFLFVMALLSVLYPALKAARIEPVKAINYR